MQNFKSKYQILFLFFLFLFSQVTYSQLSDAWLGKWKGELLIYNEAGTDKLISIHMELHIDKTDTAGIYNWRIIYKDSTKDDRKYLLRTIDQKKGKYAIDEKDGILLEMNLFDNTILSRIEVDGFLLDIIYKLETDKIIFETISGSSKPGSTSTSITEKYDVLSYTVSNYQKAYLYKSP